MSTITTKQQQAIAKLLDQMTLPKGMGTEESACSIAAINLALTGELTDRIPACMSEVIGKWIIVMQDAMPSELRNSAEWKRLLPLAAGTGRQHEKERSEIIMDWMWSTVLPIVQPIADNGGFGHEWRIMLSEKTRTASTYAATYAATYVTHDTARTAADAADDADYAATYAATYVAASAAWKAARTAAYAAAATSPKSWQQFNPCGLLERLIAVSQTAH